MTYNNDPYDLIPSEPTFRRQLNRSECPICRDGAIGMKFTRDFHNRPGVHARDIAAHYGMTEEEVMDHIQCHELVITVQADENGDLKKKISSPDFYLDELGTLYMAVRDCFESVNNDHDHIDNIKIDQIIRLSKSVVDIISKMAEIQGRINGPVDIQNHITNIEGDMGIMMDILSGGVLCDECTEKVTERLEKMLR